VFLLFAWQTNMLPQFPLNLRSTFVRFYCGLFIILLFPELSPPITKKYFQIKLPCVVEDDEKLTNIIEAEQFSFKSHASVCRSTATIIKLIRKPVKIAGFYSWHRAKNGLEWTTGSVVSYEKWCHNKLLTKLHLLGTALGIIGCTQSALPRPRANSPQKGPRFQLVRG